LGRFKTQILSVLFVLLCAILLSSSGCGGGGGGSSAPDGDTGENVPYEDASAKVRFDSSGKCYINGAPFFPVGIYDWFAPADRGKMEERLAFLSAKGFNCVLNYGNLWDSFEDVEAYLDAAERHNIKVIVSIKDMYAWSSKTRSEMSGIRGEENIVKELVRRLKDKPALLAWYINDEWPTTYAKDIKERYALLRALDPDHPTYGVLHNPKDVAAYRGCSRVFGMDSYPVPTRPLTEVADFTRLAKTIAAPCWMVIQAFDWKHYGGDWGRQPTQDEIRQMARLALENGATGLLFYAAYDLDKEGDAAWADVVRVISEFSRG
jgi:hypothetical protein